MTPLGLRRALLYRFPEFKDAKVLRNGQGKSKAFCQYRDTPVDPIVLAQWVEGRRPAGTTFECDQVATLPSGPDEFDRLQRTRLPRDIVEDTGVTTNALHEQFDRRWPGVVRAILGSHNLRIIVARGTSQNEKDEIRYAALVLLAADVADLRVEDESVVGSPSLFKKPSIPTLSRSTQQQFDRDRDVLEARVQDVLEGEPILSEFSALPAGSATFAKFSDGIDNLVHRLSLYRTVYVYMPTDEGKFTAWIGASFEEFLKALPIGRLVPVFGYLASRYAEGFLDRVLHAGAPKIVLPGEARLRCLNALTTEHPFLMYLARMDEDARRLHALFRQYAPMESKLRLLLAYVDGLADVATDVRWMARGENAVANGFGGLGKFVDDLARSATGRTSDRLIEFVEAFDLRYSCSGFSASPMCLPGHYLEPYLNIVYGAKSEDPLSLTFDEPRAVAEVLLGGAGMTLAEFSKEFQGASIDRMQELMHSPRWWEGRPPSEVVADFNAEVRHFNGARELDGVALLAGTSTTLLSGGASIVAGLAASMARPIMERIAPRLCDRFDALMTKSSKEGVLLAKIRRRLT